MKGWERFQAEVEGAAGAGRHALVLWFVSDVQRQVMVGLVGAGLLIGSLVAFPSHQVGTGAVLLVAAVAVFGFLGWITAIEIRGLWEQRSWKPAAVPYSREAADRYLVTDSGLLSRVVSDVRYLTWEEFEDAMAALFENLGHRVERPVSGRTHDFGADLLLDSGTEEATAVQVKLWGQAVGISAIQEVAAARAHYSCGRAICIAPGGFTAAAKALAQSTGVTLWDETATVARARMAIDAEQARRVNQPGVDP